MTDLPIEVTAPQSCEHESFESSVVVNRLKETEEAPVHWFSCELTLRCVGCGVLFRTVDPEIPTGVLAGRICTDVGGTTLRAPMWPDDGTEPPKGNLAGFTVKQTG